MSPPIPPATVAIPPTTRPDPPPLDWDGPHRRLDRAAQEMMGGEGRPVLGAAGARSRFVIVHHPTPAVRLDRHDPRLLGPQTLGVNPCRVQGGERPRPYEAGRPPRRAGPTVSRVRLAQLDLVVHQPGASPLAASRLRQRASAALRAASFRASGLRAARASRTAARCISGSRLARAFRAASRLSSGLLVALAFRMASRCTSGSRLAAAFRAASRRTSGPFVAAPFRPASRRCSGLRAAAAFRAASRRFSGPFVAAAFLAASLRASGLLAARAFLMASPRFLLASSVSVTASSPLLQLPLRL